MGLLVCFVALFPLSPIRTNFEILLFIFKRTGISCSVHDSMLFQQWGMTLRVMFVPCCRV